MNQKMLKSTFICPRCKQALQFTKQLAKCKRCQVKYNQSSGIWKFLIKLSPQTQLSQNIYNNFLFKDFSGPKDGSYDILASLARGNRAVDIGCGNGLILKLAPECVGVDFSLTALKQANSLGAKHLVLADAQSLPFKDNAFDMALSIGNLEHYEHPQKAVLEMARVSKMQIVVAHRMLPIPFANLCFKLFTKFFCIHHQPIENPLSFNQLKQMLTKANLRIIYHGVWTLPVNYGRVIKFLPQFNTASCWFVISKKI